MNLTASYHNKNTVFPEEG